MYNMHKNKAVNLSKFAKYEKKIIYGLTNHKKE